MNTKKRKPTEAELVNDPSLRWCQYRQWETVWSDDLGKDVRFHSYQGKKVKLATLHGMDLVEGVFDATSVRRSSTMSPYPFRDEYALIASTGFKKP